MIITLSDNNFKPSLVQQVRNIKNHAKPQKRRKATII